MSILILLVILAIVVAGSFLAAFFWATKDGQFEDTFSPSVRILMDNDRKENKKLREFIFPRDDFSRKSGAPLNSYKPSHL